METPKCPVCGGAAEKAGDYEWYCGDDGCETTFCACPFCGEWACYYSAGAKACNCYELGDCSHQIAVFEYGPSELYWYNKTEMKRFRDWCRENYPPEHNGENEDASEGEHIYSMPDDWWYGEWQHHECCEEELLKEYARESKDLIEVFFDVTLDGNATIVWFLKQTAS